MNDLGDVSGMPPEPEIEAGLPLAVAVDVQDHLMTATNDLERLETLLSDACETLMQRFYGASEQIRSLRTHSHTAEESEEVFSGVLRDLGGAVTAMQFQDMASQLINHTHQRLRSCVDRIAREAFSDDEDEPAAPEAPPLRPNPVTQSEMDVGSVELF